MESVPWVMTMRGRVRPAALEDEAPVGGGHLQAVDHHEGVDGDMEAAAAQAEHSWTWVCWKYSSPVSSLYSLSNVPPVTKIWMGWVITGFATIARYNGIISMRGTRWILLVAIAAIVFGVGITYRNQKRVLLDTAVAAPAALPADLSSMASKYHHQVTDHGRLIADVEAESSARSRTRPTSI